MSLFKKKKSGVNPMKNSSSNMHDDNFHSLPELPELPKLPDFQNKKMHGKEKIPQLPSFPNSSLGQKFSQNSIKDAVTGGKEENNEEPEEDFAPVHQVHFPGPSHNEIRNLKVPNQNKSRNMNMRYGSQAKELGTEPVFIRLDKFEDSLNLFEKIKNQLADIEKTLAHTKSIKDEEEKELQNWESNMQIIKGQIEKIDRDIFSKVE